MIKMIPCRNSLNPSVSFLVETFASLMIDGLIELSSVRSSTSHRSLMVLHRKSHLVSRPTSCSTSSYGNIVRSSDVFFFFLLNGIQIVGLVYCFVGWFISDKGFFWRTVIFILFLCDFSLGLDLLNFSWLLLGDFLNLSKTFGKFNFLLVKLILHR